MSIPAVGCHASDSTDGVLMMTSLGEGLPERAVFGGGFLRGETRSSHHG